MKGVTTGTDRFSDEVKTLGTMYGKHLDLVDFLFGYSDRRFHLCSGSRDGRGVVDTPETGLVQDGTPPP